MFQSLFVVYGNIHVNLYFQFWSMITSQFWSFLIDYCKLAINRGREDFVACLGGLMAKGRLLAWPGQLIVELHILVPEAQTWNQLRRKPRLREPIVPQVWYMLNSWVMWAIMNHKTYLRIFHLGLLHTLGLECYIPLLIGVWHPHHANSTPCNLGSDTIYNTMIPP